MYVVIAISRPFATRNMPWNVEQIACSWMLVPLHLFDHPSTEAELAKSAYKKLKKDMEIAEKRLAKAKGKA